MAFLRSFYVADDIWRFAWSLVGCLLALSWLHTHTHIPHSTPRPRSVEHTANRPSPSVRGSALLQCEWSSLASQLSGVFG